MDSESSDLTPDAGSYDIFTGMRDWRLQHPNATLTEIERALDECWHRLRARMLEDLALQHETSAWQASAVDHPTCPQLIRPFGDPCSRLTLRPSSRRTRKRSNFARP